VGLEAIELSQDAPPQAPPPAESAAAEPAKAA
jgi:hypothetical protein